VRPTRLDQASSDDGALLRDARVLVVEDDFLILIELETILRDAGAHIVGACRTVDEALALIEHEHIDAGLLDLRLGRDTTAPIARVLTRRGVPFAFYTGQTETDPIRAEWPRCEIVAKPASPRAIVAAVAGLLRQRRAE
jgi:DNA-binding response OmpR family regulator